MATGKQRRGSKTTDNTPEGRASLSAALAGDTSEGALAFKASLAPLKVQTSDVQAKMMELAKAPHVVAGTRLVEYLQRAIDDPDIQADPRVHDISKTMLGLLANADRHDTGLTVLTKALTDVNKQVTKSRGSSGGAAKAAQYEPLRKWAEENCGGVCTKAKARELAGRVPADIVQRTAKVADVGDFIYEAIRKKYAPKTRPT